MPHQTTPKKTKRRWLEPATSIAVIAGTLLVAGGYSLKDWISRPRPALDCNQGWKKVTSENAVDVFSIRTRALADLSKAAASIDSRDELFRSAIDKLKNLTVWAVPGIRWNLGAAYLELKDYATAEKLLNSELNLVGCLGREKDDELKRQFLTGTGLEPALTVREDLKQARAMTEYNLASVYAQQGSFQKALLNFEGSIADGFPRNGDDLAVVERDKNLAPLRNLAEYDQLLAPLRLRMEH